MSMVSCSDDGRDGVEEGERVLARERVDRRAERRRGQWAGRDDHGGPIRRRQAFEFAALHADIRMRRQLFRDLRREGFAVYRERAACGKLMALRRLHDERARAAHLLVQQADGVRLAVVGAEGVRADELGAVAGLVRLGQAPGPHLVQDHAGAALRRPARPPRSPRARRR